MRGLKQRIILNKVFVFRLTKKKSCFERKVNRLYLKANAELNRWLIAAYKKIRALNYKKDTRNIKIIIKLMSDELKKVRTFNYV